MKERLSLGVSDSSPVNPGFGGFLESLKYSGVRGFQKISSCWKSFQFLEGNSRILGVNDVCMLESN
jgi:hypothetical protein